MTRVPGDWTAGAWVVRASWHDRAILIHPGREFFEVLTRFAERAESVVLHIDLQSGDEVVIDLASGICSVAASLFRFNA